VKADPFDQTWLALAIGNSRLHWACFSGSRLHQAWNTPHLTPAEIALLISHQFNFNDLLGVLPPEASAALLELSFKNPPCLWLASVIPEQVSLWLSYPHTHLITLNLIPLGQQYPTLGIDRALALWGAMQICGAPVLVIDGGTALTLTGVDRDRQLVGGAILPGLRLQVRSLALGTATLPAVADLTTLPAQWANNTADAIRSGILYTVLAGMRSFIEAWRQQFPGSAIILTGGDATVLQLHFQRLYPNLAMSLAVLPDLVLQGIQGIRDLQHRHSIDE
jgi:type III pantothenate kinase